MDEKYGSCKRSIPHACSTLHDCREIGPLVKIDYHSYICESICRTKVSFLGILVEKPKTNEMVPKGSYKE